MLNGQAISIARAPERDGLGTSVECVLHQLEDVDPSVLEGQLEQPQHATAIGGVVERPVTTSQ